jgi:hypothetical protein
VKSWTEIITLIATLLASGFFSMWVVQIIKRATWPSSVKLILAIAVAIIVGLAAAWLSGDVLGITKKWGNLTAADILAFGGVVYAISAAWYERYFKGSAWMQTVAAFPNKKATS